MRRRDDRCAKIFDELAAEEPATIKLISRRGARMHNSWYANLPQTKRGDRNRLAVNPADAARHGITDGALVEIRCTSGRGLPWNTAGGSSPVS